MMNRQMELFKDGGLKDEGGMIDEVSGNEVPIGGTKKGVRDDIAANVSEGEFVMPADVVRYHGLDKMMQIRQDAKMGLKQMEAMGQMGNSDEATIPDDMPFGMADLIVVGAGDEPMEFADGGFVPSYAPGGTVKLTDNASKYEEDSSAPTSSFKELMGDAYAEVVMYINAAGDMLAVPYINGSPVYPVPDGYTIYDPSTQPEAPTEVQGAAIAAVANANAVIRNNDDRDRQQQPPPKPPVKWQEISTDEFIAEAGKMVGIGRTVMNVAMMFMGPLSLLGKGMMAINDRSVAKEIAQRIKSGEFSAAQLETLNGITGKLSGSGGIMGKVLGGIIDTVGNLFGASKEEKEVVAKVENVITKVKQPINIRPKSRSLVVSQEFQDALNELQAEQARRGVGSIDNAAGQSFRNRTVGPAGQNAVRTTTTGGSNVSGSGTSQAQLEETTLGIDPDSSMATVSGQVPTTTTDMTGAPGFRDGVTKTSANLTGSGRPTGAIYKDSATTSTAGSTYDNIPIAVTPAGVDPRAGAMQYSGPNPFATTGQTPVQTQMASAFTPTSGSPYADAFGDYTGSRAVTNAADNTREYQAQTAANMTANRLAQPMRTLSGNNFSNDPTRGYSYPTDAPGYVSSPVVQGMRGIQEGSNVYVDPNTGRYDEVPVVPKEVVVGGTGGGTGGGPAIIPPEEVIVDTPIIDGPKIVPISDAVVGDVISKLPDDQLTGNFGQDYQLFNPDIDYTNAYVASNNQIVGTLDPKYDPSYDGPTYSASDFQIGASTTGTDFSAYDPKLTDDSTIATNASGSKVSVGYGMGQVDPALADLAGYNTDKAFTYVDPNTGSYDEVPTTLKKVTDTSNAVEIVTPSKTLIAETTADSIRNEDPGGALYDEFGDVVKESFGDALSRNKSAGKSTFTHEGNVYTTETAAEKADTSDTGTAATSTVATSNVVNKTGTAVVKEDQSRYGDAGEGNVWAVQPGTNVVTKVKDTSSNKNSGSSGSSSGSSGSSSTKTTTTTRTAAEIQKDINAEVGGGKPWTAKANELVKERDAAKANKDNNDKPDKPSGGGSSCCFIMLEARYGNGTMDEVVRRYRDEYMTDRNRRGYYKLAEVLVPLMRKSKVFKWVVTKTFADPLVSYGKYYYGQGKVGVLYSPVKSFWMKVFNVIGGETEFIRENGEVV